MGRFVQSLMCLSPTTGSWTVLPSMTLSGGVMSTTYYQESQGPPSPPKYENGHDTFSDFVTLVCQETQNTPHHSQVKLLVNIVENLANISFKGIYT